MARYEIGETVTITLARFTITGEVNDGHHAVALMGQDRHGNTLTIDVSDPHVIVWRNKPADGVPRPGEVWADATGERYFARSMCGRVVFVPEEDDAARYYYDWPDVHRDKRGPIHRVWSPRDVPVETDGGYTEEDYGEPEEERGITLAEANRSIDEEH